MKGIAGPAAPVTVKGQGTEGAGFDSHTQKVVRSRDRFMPECGSWQRVQIRLRLVSVCFLVES